MPFVQLTAIWVQKKSSTELAAIELLDRLLDQLRVVLLLLLLLLLNQQKIPINFLLDLTKAFDGLNHNILIDNDNDNDNDNEISLFRHK